MTHTRPRWTIIDGNNLMHADPELAAARRRDFQSARLMLIRRLEAIFAQADGPVTVVFDSLTPKTFTGFEGSSLDVRFSEPGAGSDALIERLVHADPEPARITVITSDAVERRVVDAAGAMSISCRMYLSQLGHDREEFAGRVQRAAGKTLKPSLGELWSQKQAGEKGK